MSSRTTALRAAALAVCLLALAGACTGDEEPGEGPDARATTASDETPDPLATAAPDASGAAVAKGSGVSSEAVVARASGPSPGSSSPVHAPASASRQTASAAARSAVVRED